MNTPHYSVNLVSAFIYSRTRSGSCFPCHLVWILCIYFLHSADNLFLMFDSSFFLTVSHHNFISVLKEPFVYPMYCCFTGGCNLSLQSWVRYIASSAPFSECRKNMDFVVKLGFQYWLCYLFSWDLDQVTSLRSIHPSSQRHYSPPAPPCFLPFSFTVILRYNLCNIKCSCF